MEVSGQLPPPAALALLEQETERVTELVWTSRRRENSLSLKGIELRLLGSQTRSQSCTNDYLLIFIVDVMWQEYDEKEQGERIQKNLAYVTLITVEFTVPYDLIHLRRLQIQKNSKETAMP